MKPLFYLLSRIYKNTLLQLIKKPVTLVAYILFIALISINPIIIMITGSKMEVMPSAFNYYLLFTLLIVGITVLPAMYNAINKVSLPLRTADVNFLFTAPLRPSQILIYSQIIQSVTSLFVAVIMLLQGPLLMQFLGVGFERVLLFVAIWAILLVAGGPIYMFIFTIGHRFPRAKTVMRYTFFAYIGGVVLWFVISIMKDTTLVGGVANVIKNPIFSYLPILGWYEAMFAAVIFGLKLETLIVGILILVSSTAATVAMVKLIDTSFYEEAIKSSERLEKAKAAYKSGDHSFASALQLKNKKVKGIKFAFRPKGAKTIMQKQWLEERKRTIYLLDIKTLICIAGSVGVGYLISTDGDLEKRSIILIGALIANAYALFLFSLRSNKNELSKHYIYMIPDTIYNKLYAISYLQGLSFLVDGTLSVVAVAIVFRIVSFEVIIIPITLLCFGLQLYFMDMILNSFLGRIGTMIIKMYIKIIISTMSILPGVILMVALMAMDKPMALALAITTLLLAGFDAILYLIAANIFKRPEMNV